MIEHIRVGWTECNCAAVATFAQAPLHVPGGLLSAVILRAANDVVVVGGMNRHADELRDLKIAVQISPGQRARAIQPPDSAIARIEDSPGAVECDGMMIHMRAIAIGVAVDAAPACSAVGGADEISRPAGVDVHWIGGIDDKRGVIPALAPQIRRHGGSDIRPVCSRVDRLEHFVQPAGAGRV